MDYNDAMSRGTGPAQRSGWRRMVEQFARFEYVLSGWDWSRVDRVLDLGCGTGELAAWMKRTSRDAEYIGVDRRDDAIDEARRRHPQMRFLNGDLYEVCRAEADVDLTVAIGTLIDGEVPSGDEDRRRRVRRLADEAIVRSRVGAVVVALNQTVIDERPELALEPALFGIEPDAFGRIVREATPRGWCHRVRGNLLGTDLVGTVWTEGAFEPVDHAELQQRACRRAVEADEVGGLDESWLWEQVERDELARGNK